MFAEVLRIRRIEERLAVLYAEQEMRCPTHFSIGQEAVAVGTISALTPQDVVMGAHRSHAIYLAKGGSLNAMIAELYGKATGCTGGRGGSMHLSDPDVGFLGSTPIVGSTIPIAAGVAFGDLLQGRSRIVAVFFGDGATETGIFHETVNFALLHRLPLLMVCENNLYSIFTGLEERQPSHRTIVDVVAGHGMPAERCDGQDVEAVRSTAERLVHEIRAGGGPRFVEYLTYRFVEHCGPNPERRLGHRSAEELEAWERRDPVLIERQRLEAAGLLPPATLSALEQEIAAEIDAALAFASSSPYPSAASLTSDVYAPQA